METGEIIQNGGLVIGGGLMAQLMNWGRDWWKARQAVKVEQPLEVSKRPAFITVAECNRRMCEMEQRIDSHIGRINSTLEKIVSKLDEIDQRGEERAIALNRRIDPVIEKVAANSASIEFLKGQRQ